MKVEPLSRTIRIDGGCLYGPIGYSRSVKKRFADAACNGGTPCAYTMIGWVMSDFVPGACSPELSVMKCFLASTRIERRLLCLQAGEMADLRAGAREASLARNVARKRLSFTTELAPARRPGRKRSSFGVGHAPRAGEATACRSDLCLTLPPARSAHAMEGFT